jgi:Kef-type K+ transport system membrane component KefB/nucleotide-binding universal stress UspA family protein
MLVPFVLGFGLGLWLPEEFLAQPDRRVLFAAFIATAMSISAMPVIAKILMDLDLTRRNIGLVILSAGVVDDTAGWLILSVIAGAATQGGSVQLGGLLTTFLWMSAFLAAMAFVIYPLLRFGFRLIARSGSSDTDLVVIVIFALLAAAITEHIGVHAVFGAFIAGTLLRQVSHIESETVHRLESFVFSILAPVFFGTVGLKVDLWTLASGGGGMVLIVVVGIACLGKLVGCSLGGLWGGLSFWEAMSIAVAMNARGAMELVVASIGLSLGILNPQMFSIIVVVAITTSFLAPVLLRMTMRMVQMTRDERDRMLAEESRGAFDTDKLRVLVPTAGGPNALVAAKLGLGLAAKSADPVEIVYVDEKGTTLERLLRFLGPSKAGKGFEEHVAALKKLAGDQAIRVRRVVGRAASEALIQEASKGVDVILAGASGGSAKLGGRVLADIVERAPCHVAIIKAGKKGSEMKRVFVPIDGSSVSRVAAEFALHYVESVAGELTLGILSERRTIPLVSRDQPDDLPDGHRPTLTGVSQPPPPSERSEAWHADGGPRVSQLPPDAAKEELIRISPVFRVAALTPRIERIDYDAGLGAVAEAIVRGGYDLVVLGAENRAVRQRLFFGHENQRIIDLDSVTTTILVPNLARLH